MDTRFSIAVHLMILVSEAGEPMSSSAMAESVGTNPSFVRKVLGSLKGAQLIDSSQGRAGFALRRPPGEITLLQIHQALYGSGPLELFAIHRNPSDECVVGRLIRPTLEGVFSRAAAEARATLADTTLADCIGAMREMAAAGGPDA